MSKQQAPLGELELAVLKAIWENQPVTVQQAAEIIGERRGSARTTVLTVMQRLHAKKYLKRQKVDGLFRYSTTQARGKVISRLIEQFLDRVLDGSPLPFVAYLTEKEGLTEEEAEALRSIAESMRSREEGRSE